MDLHELLSTAVADLPDTPDLVPEAQRIHHRRTAVTKAGAVAATAALVVGAGTLTIASPWSRAAHSKVMAGAPSPSSASVSASIGPIFEVSPGQRKPAPVLSGTTLQGQPLSVSYPGHVTVINLWGSWCTPCREEAPDFAEAYTKYKSKGVEFIGINTRDNDAAAIAYTTELAIGYPSLRDPADNLAAKLSPFVPSDSVPTAVIIDAHGDVAVRILGTVTAAQLDAQIAYAEAT